MGFLSFGSKFQVRKFEYNPRYYDPVKEEFDKRMKRYKREGNASDLAKDKIRGGFRKNYNANKQYVQNESRRTNRIRLIVFGVLLLLTVFFIMEYLPGLMTTLQETGQ